MNHFLWHATHSCILFRTDVVYGDKLEKNDFLGRTETIFLKKHNLGIHMETKLEKEACWDIRKQKI
jgi:hypothetical protein